MLKMTNLACLKPVQGFSKTFVQSMKLTHSLDGARILLVHKQLIYTPIRNVMNGFTQSIYTGLNSIFNQLNESLYPSSTDLTTATAVYKLQGGSK